jgi:hypothetical protein
MLHFSLVLMLVAASAVASDDPVVFRSDVALTRIDAQVVDRSGHSITGLEANDFVLRLDGRELQVRDFASENMPIDILLLVDVSGSMEPHVQRIASAARAALNVLADQDRVAIMVFDTRARVRLRFRSNHGEITDRLNHLLRSESFSGGTHITHALVDAAAYLQRESRPEARRAVVILTDDERQDEEDEASVESALARANAVMSFLQAPYEPPTLSGNGPVGGRYGTWGSGGTWPGGGGWPGGGVGLPGGGPVILGRGGPGTYGADRSHSAGTAQIATDSGGDVMRVDEASSLEDTLARLRQRYALYCYLPEGSWAGSGSIQVDLSQEARLRFLDAEIHYRRIYMSGSGSGEHSGPMAVTSAHPTTATSDESTASRDQPVRKGRRVAVNEDSGPRVNIDPSPQPQN